MQIIKVYYQDFSLNSFAFNDSDLILNEAKSVLITVFSRNKLISRLSEFQIDIDENASMVEIADACFRVFNLYPMEFSSCPSNFKNIGHTSMSVGDYVTFLDGATGEEDVLICAKSGWKSLPSTLTDFIENRDLVIQHIMDLPIDTLEGMYSKILQDKVTNNGDFKRILNMCKDFRCEDTCPKCGAVQDDIDWGIKDYSDSTIFQNATCRKCGCMFTEEYNYARTSVDEETEKEMEE